MNQFRLAPLCGVTDRPYRTICAAQGCECGYTEMVSAMGFLCAPEGQTATYSLLERSETERKLICQLFGKDPETVAKAAAKLADTGRYDGIDINMGCPAHKIAPSGEGCGLMRTPDIAEKMIRRTVEECRLPVSIKMRLGWDSNSINAVDFAKMAENAGVTEITVHGRTREQQYSGEADWDLIGEVKRSVSVPVIGNGDIFDAITGIRRMRDYGVDGIMIGRGAMGNPWIFRELKAASEDKPVPEVTAKERMEAIQCQYMMMLDWKPEYIAVREMRKHIGWYLHGMRGAGQMRVEINRIESASEALEKVRSFLEMNSTEDDSMESEEEKCSE